MQENGVRSNQVSEVRDFRFQRLRQAGRSRQPFQPARFDRCEIRKLVEPRVAKCFIP